MEQAKKRTIKSSMLHRSYNHDYRSAHFYMITMVVQERIPVLGRLVGNPDEARMALSPLGHAVAKEWAGIPGFYPEVKTVALQLMPDHLHGILQVRVNTDYHLGQVIKGFKVGCNKALRCMLASLDNLSSDDASWPTEMSRLASVKAIPVNRATLWQRGYNDKILWKYGTLGKWKQYLIDNPRRLAVRRFCRDFFKVRFDVAIGIHTYAAIGNRQLLDYPWKERVQLSRTEKDIKGRVDYYLELARQGAVLVSPSISGAEQAVMRAAFDERLPLIFLTPWGFNAFSKPGHRYFEACAQGRFLILAPWEHNNQRVDLTREMCMELNEMALEISAR